MRRKALVWKLFPIYFLITLASVLVISLYALDVGREFYYSQVESDLATRARMVRRWITEDHLFPGDAARLSRTLKSLDTCCGTRITLILPSGRVVADSEHDSSTMENHRNRPEFRQALVGPVGVSRRVSPTLHITMIYVAMPIAQNGRTIGVVRASLPANAIDARPSALYHHVLLGTLLVALLAGIVSLLAARRIARPIREIRNAASRLALGDLDSRVRPPDTEELGSLADTLNTMAARISGQVRTITQQSGEQHAILAGMVECVIAVDNEERIMLLNPRAEELLGVRLDQVKGKTIQEAVRNPALQRFFGESSASEAPTAAEITIHGQQQRVVQAIGTSLVDADGSRIGALVVLNDVTQMRRLENVRKDFVANVSHELKTPITAIRGFVETLRRGGMDESKTDEFLGIIEKQSLRLQSIIEDLLMLSDIEQQADRSQIPIELTRVQRILTSAVALCQPRAEASGIQISLCCDGKIEALANGQLLEQAVVNLLDNAIKYSGCEQVNVIAECAGAELIIRVSDAGRGIDPEHLPRLFERFYRVDKARSRGVGGTGLGLAIVKHIAQAHRGRVDVTSTPASGSTFSIYLPMG